MTTREIQMAMGYEYLEPLRKVWVKHFGDGWPHGDAQLPKEKALALLTILAQPTTRRKPEHAEIAAELLRKVQENGQYVPPDETRVQATQSAPKPKNVVGKQQIEMQTTRREKAQTVHPVPKKKYWFEYVTMLDVVYLATIATAVYGLWFNLREMGIAFAVPYTLVSFHALRMAKNPESAKTAQAGIAAVVVLEILTFFIHLTMFNLRIIQATKQMILPFSYEWYSGDMKEIPFFIACVLSALFSAAGVYAVSVTFSLTMEKHNSKKTAELEAEKRESHYKQLRDTLEEAARHLAKMAGQNEHNPDLCDGLAQRYFMVIKGVGQ